MKKTTLTRHLDMAIEILGGGKARTPRKHVITLQDLGAVGVSVQVNGKEVWLAPDMARAREDAQRRSDAMQRLKGIKPVIKEN